jgi:MFS family permease
MVLMTTIQNPDQFARKITSTLFFAQSLGSAALISVATVQSLVGTELGGHDSWAGIPAMVFLSGSSLAALIWGHLMDRLGRRGGIISGLVVGSLGALLAGSAVIVHSFAWFLVGLLLLGVAQAALLLSRFAAAEVHPPEARGRAISNVVIGGTVGSILGPLLVGPTSHLSIRAGFDELAGPFGAAAGLLAIAILVISIRLKPDPRELGIAIAQRYPQADPSGGMKRTIPQILLKPASLVAVLAMVFAQMVMVMLMVITAVHMRGHDHALTNISFVIASHTFGMYAFSIISGRLSDRWGRLPVILFGSGTLALACLLAPLSPALIPLSFSLFLLGLGWNFCYVGGSSLLSDQLSPSERSRVQGVNDLLIGLASAVGSAGSGVVFAFVGFAIMGLTGAIFALIPLMATLWWLLASRNLAVARR